MLLPGMVEAGSVTSPPLCLPQGPRPDWDRVGKVVFRHWSQVVAVSCCVGTGVAVSCCLLCVGTGVGEGREQSRAVHPKQTNTRAGLDV